MFVFITIIAACLPQTNFDNADNEQDDDTVGLDDDANDDDLADDDVNDDDSADDDVQDDDTQDDDSADDDAQDDDTADDDIIDDDTTDDDTIDDDTVDDDTSLTPPLIYNDGDLMVELIDGGRPGAQGSAAAVGPDGEVYVAYTRGTYLLLAKTQDQITTYQMLAPYASSPELAVDGHGHLHLVYLDIITEWVVYLTNASGAWVKKDLVGVEGYMTYSISADADGAAHIVYALDSEDGDHFIYATNAGGAWTEEEVAATDSVFGCAIALDADDQPHLAFTEYDNGAVTLKYAKRNGKGWDISVVDAGISGSLFKVSAWYPSLAIDSEGQVTIGYMREVYIDFVMYYISYYYLMVAEQTDNGWTTLRLPEIEGTSRLTKLITRADAQGGVHLAAESAGDEAWYFARSERGWEMLWHETVDGPGTTFAVAADGAAHLFYRDHAEGWFTHATNAAGDWAMTVIDNSRPTGDSPDAKFDQNHVLHIAYADDAGAIKTAVSTPEGWSFETAETNTLQCDVDEAIRLRMALDADNREHIFYNRPNDYTCPWIRHAWRGEGSWSFEFVVEQPYLEGIAAAIDPNGGIHTVFAKYPNIYHAQREDKGWVGEVIDTTGYVSNPMSALIADSASHLHLAASRSTQEDLYGLVYNTNASGDWTPQPIINGQISQYREPSIALDQMGRVHIAVGRDSTGRSQNGVEWHLYDGADWTSETVIVYPNFEKRISATALVVDADNQPQVIFAMVPDDGVGEIIYAHRTAKGWELQSMTWIPSFGNTLSAALDEQNFIHVVYRTRDALYRVSFPIAR